MHALRNQNGQKAHNKANQELAKERLSAEKREGKGWIAICYQLVLKTLILIKVIIVMINR